MVCGMCDPYPYLCEQGQNGGAWHGQACASAVDMNEEMKALKQNTKKMNANGGDFQPGDTFGSFWVLLFGQSKAGLVNHARQKYSEAARC